MRITLTAALGLTAMMLGCGAKDDPQPAPAAEAEAAPDPDGEGQAARVDAEEAEADAPPPRPLTFMSTDAPAASVEIVMVVDFQCPFCARVLDAIEEVRESYGEEVRLTVLHNPLAFHPQARDAAIAAVAAQRQGKFWEMHDTLFEHQKQLMPDDLAGYAEAIGLSPERFAEDIADPEVAAFVDTNQAIAKALGARGTPTFFINGKVLRGAQPFAQFKALIDAELDAVGDEEGDAAIEARTRAQNEQLFEYLHEGEEPPATAPRAPTAADRLVFKVPVNPETDVIDGPADAPVTIVTFSEFQCPFCARLAPTLDELQESYGDDVRRVFKHQPLGFHKHAMPAANAAMCAHAQGKFWEMHDLLFEHQRALDGSSLERYASQLELDMPAWKACVEGGDYEDQILEDMETAVRVRSRGTPNTYINGRKISGTKPIEEFRALIDEELERAKELIAGGTAAEDVYEALTADGETFEPLDQTTHTFDLEGSPTVGPEDAPVQLVVFSDFQCPFCASLTAPLEEVRKHYGDDVRVAFKHFPLSYHQDALPAAIAAMCAHDQGKFWEMHDVLFRDQSALAEDDLKGYAEDLSLDTQAFDACFSARRHKEKVQRDMAEARRAGVRSGATVFINGRKFNPTTGHNAQAYIAAIERYVLGDDGR